MKNRIYNILPLLAAFAFSVSLYGKVTSDTISVFGQTTGEATFPDSDTGIDFKWHGDQTAIVDSVIYGYDRKPEWTSSHNSPVWGLPVNFDVSQSGAATFSLPIDVPKGIGNVSPRLSISYNSLSGNGAVGLGCGISGVSSITRHPNDIYHDGKASGVDFSSTDALSLDGLRMVLKSGKSMEDGAVYVLENDPFTELAVHGSGESLYFTASFSDGGTATYGHREGCRQTVTAPDGSRQAASWYMERTADTNGNYIDYSYKRTDGFMYISEVSYGGNLRYNSPVPLQNRVLFHYGSRPDVQSAMLGKTPCRMSQRLELVEAYCGDSLYRSYKPEYKPAPVSGYSLLRGVLVENSSGLVSYVLKNEWGERGSLTRTERLGVSPSTIGLSDAQRRIYVSADMNGDGISDILELVPSKVSLGSGSYTYKTYCIPNLSGPDGTGGVRFVRHKEFEVDYETLARRGSFLTVSSGTDGCSDLVIPELAGSLSGKSNILRFHVFRGGKDGVTDKWHDAVPEFKLFAWTKELPLCAAADIDNDGVHEIIAVEKTAMNSSYGCTVVKYTNGGATASGPVLKCLNLESAPRSLFTGDFNNDGLTDILLVFDKKYVTFLNDGTNDIVSWKKVYGGSTVKESGHLESGDFNGDGVPDLIMHDGGSLTIALCNGDGTFTACPSQSFDGLSKLSSDSSQLNIYDFDGDGMSDVVVTKNNGRLNTCWLKSSGTSLSLLRKSSLAKDSGDNPVYASVGDFDGDGRPELLNYGYDCTSAAGTATNDRALRAYPGGDASTEKIKSVSDRLGNNVSIEYEPMASGGIYERGSSAKFPIMDVTAPICAVASVERSNGEAGPNTTEYRYGGLRLHCQGKGTLGMSVFTAENATLGTSQRTEVKEWDGTYLIPTKTLSVQKSGDSESTALMETAVVGKEGKSFFSYTRRVTVTDFDGNATLTENTFDTERGCPLSTRTTCDDGAYRATEYAEYARYGGRWLPGKVTETVMHPDDNAEFASETDIGYDDRGNTVRQTTLAGTPKERSMICEYDVYGNVTAYHDEGDGIATVRHISEYGNNGRDITRTYTEPESTVAEYEYDIYGNAVREKDLTYGERGVTTTRIYDTAGRNAVTISPEGIHSGTVVAWSGSNSEDIPGSVFFKVDYGKCTPWTKTWYDACGRELKSETIGFGSVLSVTETEYDSRGLVTAVKTRSGDLVTTVCKTYDSRGRLLTESTSSGSVKRYTYGNRRVYIYDNGRQYSREYDSWGNLRKSADPVATVEYRYGSNGKPKSVSCGGSTVCMEYDEAGNRTVLDDPDAGRIETSYDAEGKVVSRTDGRGIESSCRYDRLGRLSLRTGASGLVSYTYDRYGNVTRAEHSGNTESTRYDKFRRKTGHYREYAGGKTHEYTYRYNGAGQLETQVYPGNVTVDYTYDSYGNRTAVKVGGTEAWRLRKSTGRQTVEEVLSGKLTLTEERTDNGYLSSSVLGMNTDNQKAKELSYARYVFDEARGNLLSRSFSGTGKKETFSYDAMDRLTGFTPSFVASPAGLGETDDSTAQYDTPGTATGPVIGPGTAGGLTSGEKYSYAANGNITYATALGNYEYDAGRPHAVAGVEAPGDVIPAAPQRVEYNDIDKVDRISETDGSGTAFDLYYDYGPDDERWTTEMTGGGKTLYRRRYAPSCDIVTEDGVERKFLYLGNGVLHYSENGGEGRLLYMFTDHQGSVRRIYDADGNEIFSAEYGPWGYATVKKNLIGFTRGYTGHETLPEFSLIDMNGRLYDPVLGRFLSPDNYVQVPESSQSFNRYSYCMNNPLKYTDPSGQLFIIDDFMIGVYKGLLTGKSIWKSAIRLASNAVKIYTGLFATDPNKSFGGRVLELFSRFTFQNFQTSMGFSLSLFANSATMVKSVRHKYGATVLTTTMMPGTSAATLGSYILGNKNTVADANNVTFQHEYGHYLQSQTMGWGYMFKVAIPSFVSAAVKKSKNHKYRSFERDANNRAFKYFNKYVKGFYVSKDEYPHNSHGWNFDRNPLVDISSESNYVDYYDLLK